MQPNLHFENNNPTILADPNLTTPIEAKDLCGQCQYSYPCPQIGFGNDKSFYHGLLSNRYLTLYDA